MPTNSAKTSSLANQFLDLNNKLIGLENIDEIFSLALSEIAQIFLSKFSLFAILLENTAVVEVTLGDYQGKENFSLKKKNLEKLLQNEFVLEEALIFLPILVQDKLIGLIISEINPRDLNEDSKKAINKFTQIFSKIINQNQVIADLKTINENLLNQDKHKTELISTVSHELRTPLTNILGYSELLKKIDLDETKIKFYLNEIHLAALRLSSMINNYLDLARVEAQNGIQLSHREKNEIDWLAKKAWESLSFINHGHQIIFEKTPKLNEVDCDSEAIARVFTNLFSNAIKYSNPLLKQRAEAANIICKIQKNKNEIEVSIIDHGIGIDPEEKEKLFEKFSRIESKETEFIYGSGLGLWISKEIVKAHGGKIYCESEKGKYTNFTFTLPKGNNIKR